jgi:hypothetical protein
MKMTVMVKLTKCVKILVRIGTVVMKFNYWSELLYILVILLINLVIYNESILLLLFLLFLIYLKILMLILSTNIKWKVNNRWTNLKIFKQNMIPFSWWFYVSLIFFFCRSVEAEAKSLNSSTTLSVVKLFFVLVYLHKYQHLFSLS